MSPAPIPAEGDVDVPPFMTPGEIADASGETVKRTKTLLRNAGLIEQNSKGAWRRVDTARLLERLPTLYRRVYRALVIRGRARRKPTQTDPKRPKPTQTDP